MRYLVFVLAALALLVSFKTCSDMRRDDARAAAAHPCLSGRLVSDRGSASPASVGGISSVNTAIRRQMHNPSSFDHVVTQVHPVGESRGGFRVAPNESLVGVQYRGTNAFGGTMTEQVVAVINPRTCAFLRFLE